MTYFNRTGAEFFTVGDSGVDFDSRRQLETPPLIDDGLYFRHHDFPELSDMVTACKSGEMVFADLTLDAYQAWNETGWKVPQATIEAAQRLGAKAEEERREVNDALEDFYEDRQVEHLVEELGDYHWVITAIANNCGVIASDGVKARLYDYAMGTRTMASDGSFRYADWYDTAAQLSIKRDSLTLGDIDSLMTAGFAPRFSPGMNLYEPEQISPTAYMFDLTMYNSLLRGIMQNMYEDGARFGQRAQESPDSQTTAKVVAEIYLRVAAIAHAASSSMSEVVAQNIRKVDERIARRAIDKTDPNRV